MNSIICLALSCLLVGLLYVFMRQQFAAQDRKISDLTQLVASVASELQQSSSPVQPASPPQLEVKRLPEFARLPERVTVSDDSESETDTDDESSVEGNAESDDDVIENVEVHVKKIVEPEELPFENTLDMVEDISIVLDLNEGTKTINLFDEVPSKPNLEKLTVKDLKDLVAKNNGPSSLKTKKELIEFLEKKK